MKLKFWETDTYTWTDYRKYLSWIDEPTKTSLWNNKELIAGTIALGVISLLALRYMRKPVAQKPIVTFESTLGIAGLTLESPAGKALPPDVTITFCIDRSGSMEGERENQVKEGVLKVLTDAKLRAEHGANFNIAIVGFASTALTISTPKNIKSFDEIKKELECYRSSGGTNILVGLEEATTQLQTLAKVNQKATHLMILLTDGEAYVSPAQVLPILTKLAAVNAQLFAIGIGEYKEATLQTIAPNKYIDTTKGTHTIVTAISQIYNHVIAQYSDIKLSTTQLKAGTWSVNRALSVARNGRSECDLGTLNEGKKMEQFIQIHGEKLDSDLPLSTVKFDLSYKDPRGIPGQMSLRWRPNTIVNHKLCKRAQNFIRI